MDLLLLKLSPVAGAVGAFRINGEQRCGHGRGEVGRSDDGLVSQSVIPAAQVREDQSHSNILKILALFSHPHLG